jgi:hypothetical protein
MLPSCVTPLFVAKFIPDLVRFAMQDVLIGDRNGNRQLDRLDFFIVLDANQNGSLDFADVAKWHSELAALLDEISAVVAAVFMLACTFILYRIQAGEALGQDGSRCSILDAKTSDHSCSVPSSDQLKTLQQELSQTQQDYTTALRKIDDMSNRIEALEAELQEARDQIADQATHSEQVQNDKDDLERELEASEALLEIERDQAQRILKHVRKHGCHIDGANGLKAKYAKDALNGKFGECSIVVNYENNLRNPVGAIVYNHDDELQCTKILAAFAAPRRGITAANFEAVKERARRNGDTSVTLDAIPSAVAFWKHMGFIEDDCQSLEGVVQMSMPLANSP